MSASEPNTVRQETVTSEGVVIVREGTHHSEGKVSRKTPSIVFVDQYGSPRLLNPKVEFTDMSRVVSKATVNCYKQTEDLWKILNAIPDQKIEKFEWNFILKLLGKDGPILTQNESDFLFNYLDKDNSGDITKPELRSLLNLVVRENKWDENNSPTKDEMLKLTFKYAYDDIRVNSAVDFTLQMAVIKANNSLLNMLREMKNAKKHYENINGAIEKREKDVFKNPDNIFTDHLKKHEEIINKYADGPLKSQYDEIKNLLQLTKKEYDKINAQIKEFLEQGHELERLRERDAKCCKFLGCLCPCTF